MKTPTIHHPAETVCFLEYPKLKAIVKELAKAMETAKYITENLPYEKRMSLLTRFEHIYCGIYNFGDALAKAMEKERFDKQNHRFFLDALKRANIIEIGNGQVNDYHVFAPPLGDRYGGNAAMMAYFTEKALETAKKEGVRFGEMDEICIIVKQFCHCAEVAMGTLENREIHSITDTIVKRMGLDDDLWHADCCYCWCESPQPRTEIIITDRKMASLYGDFINSKDEEPLQAAQKYAETKAKKARMRRNIDEIKAIVKTVDTFDCPYDVMHRDTSRHLARLTKCLSEIIVDLRSPFISSTEHEYSSLYSQADTSPKKENEQNSSDEIAELESLMAENSSFDDTIFHVTVKTQVPRPIKYASGRDLCETQEYLLTQRMPKVGYSIGFFDSSDLAVSIEVWLSKPHYHMADADNMNTAFLRKIAKRVKIIYISRNNNSRHEDGYCIIQLCPKSCFSPPAFWI